MQAAEKDGIKRYIMLSSLYALQPEMWSKVPSLASIMDYNITSSLLIIILSQIQILTTLSFNLLI